MLKTIDANDLVDIRNVQVDATLPKYERIVSFINQIKNPYQFKCGDFVVSVKYAKNGVSLEDCLERLAAIETQTELEGFQSTVAPKTSGVVL